MPDPIFALIDCNNFFVSCERLFRPDLKDRPVVVLSSNDGCVVSRSNEAKHLGIPMGAPAFQYRQLFRQQGVVQFSANFELYGDISERITRLLTGITPRTEVYSVDEAFLDLSQLQIANYTHWATHIRQRLHREVGIPVAIGIAPTKTLSKLAGEHAKKEPQLGGILDLTPGSGVNRQQYLALTPVKDIWGVGWRLAPKLQAEGIYTALDVLRLRPRHANQLMGVHGRQLVAELNGLSCLPLASQAWRAGGAATNKNSIQTGHYAKPRQSVMKGRMFGEDTGDFSVIEAAIASLTARAAQVLRRESLLAQRAILSLSTNRHKPGYQRRQESMYFVNPTADTGYITARLVAAAQTIYNPASQYHRANILLYDLVNHHNIQADLFGALNLAQHEAARTRLQAVDSLNDRYGSGTVRYAAEDLSQAWQPRHRLRSPRYTTNWQELPQLSSFMRRH